MGIFSSLSTKKIGPQISLAKKISSKKKWQLKNVSNIKTVATTIGGQKDFSKKTLEVKSLVQKFSTVYPFFLSLSTVYPLPTLSFVFTHIELFSIT